MPDSAFIPLSTAIPGPNESICKALADESGLELIKFLARNMGIPSAQLGSGTIFVYSPTPPGADERNRVWIKTAAPFGIGIFAGGEWQLITAYPIGAYLMWPASRSVPPGAVQLTNTDITNAGLPTLGAGSIYIQFR
jgi:hypothetical protein